MSDFSKIPNQDPYCPDLSDMCDDSFIFWDFLSEIPPKPELIKSNNEKCEDTEDEFWDFLGSSATRNQSQSHLQTLGPLEKSISCGSSNWIKRENGSCNSHYECNSNNPRTFDSIKNTSDTRLKSLENTDDEFWDFLKCNSPNGNIQGFSEENTNSHKTPFSNSLSFRPLPKNTSNQSTNLLQINTPSKQHSTVNAKNTQLWYQNDQGEKTKNKKSFEEYKSIRDISQSKAMYHGTEIVMSVDEIYATSTPKPSKKIDMRAGLNSFKSPDNSSKLTDEEFWDFLNCDSPYVRFQDAISEYSNSVYKESTALKDSGFSFSCETTHEESPFESVSFSADSGRNSIVSDTTTHISINMARHLENENHMNHNRQLNTANSSSSQYKTKSGTVSFQNNNEIKVDRNTSSSASTATRIEESISSYKTEPSEDSSTKLPCISSVFSVSMYPDWLRGAAQYTPPYCSASIATDEYSQESNKTVSENRKRGGKYHADKIGEDTKRNRCSLAPVSPVGCSEFKVIDADTIPNLKMNETGNDSLNVHENQMFANAMSSDINKAQFKPTRINFQPVTSTTNTALKNSTITNASNNSKNLYLVLPKSQNYSHFLVLLNNNTDLEKNKNASTSTSMNNLKNNSTCKPTNTVSESQIKSNGVLNIPVSNLQLQSTNLHSNGRNISKQSVVHRNIIQNDSLTTSNAVKCSNIQSSENFSTVNNPTTSLSTDTNVIFLLNDGSTISSVSNATLTNHNLKTQKIPQSIQKPSDRLNLKTLPYKAQRPIRKSVSLGKDKNCILQTSIPLKMGNISENKHLCDAQGNVINYFYDSNTSSALHQSINANVSSLELSETLNDTASRNGLHNANANCTIPSQSQNSTSAEFTVSSTESIANVCISDVDKSSIKPDFELKNTSTVDQFKRTSNIFPTAISNSDIVLPNNSTSFSNSYKLDVSKPNVSASCGNQVQSNTYVQVKVAPAQFNAGTLTNLQELFPPPISMVPVCVMPKTQTVIQPTVPKVLILKGIGQQQQMVRQSLHPQPNPSTEQPKSDKKQKVKSKKTGRKTVRELLQEREQTQSGPLKREIRVLRPVQKIPTCSTFYQAILPKNKSNTMCSGMQGNVSSSLAHETQQNFNKRPNILMLPSTCKVMKKNVIKDDSMNLLKVKVGEATNYSPQFEVSQQGLLSYRPRHYAMSELHIGYFKVDDGMDSCGRFRCKFKVIFSKRQFLYEFPVCRCNRVELKSSESWEQMARIVVPFKIITSIAFGDRTIHLNINSTPLICLGRLQARSGIISNATVYDAPLERDSTWSNAITSSSTHKVVLRKKQVHKLKTFLYQFDEFFISLTRAAQSGIYNSNSLCEGELSPSTLKRSFTKNKKSGVCRLPQWDSPEPEVEKTDDEIDILKPQMCSCRISCRSVRCSCAKSAKSCSSVCTCINCGNPLNVLESIGINIAIALKDRCLFQNIYRIPNLLDLLKREIKLSCCHSVARVRDCIPGPVLCPNVGCNVPMEFSWCRVIVCYPDRNPRNHCSVCGQCCFSNGRHCMTCNRCYVTTSSKCAHCPNCQEKTTYDANFVPNMVKPFPQASDSAPSAKLHAKPEIILLDAHSIPKDPVVTFENMEGVIETDVHLDAGDRKKEDGQMDFAVDAD